MDGLTLVRELQSSPTLSALWLSSLARPVTYSFPVIVRLHSDDSPYLLLDDERALHRTALATMEAFPDVDVTFARGEFDDSPFEPYRLPDSPQQWEGLYLPFRGAECHAQGRLKLSDIPRFACHIAETIARCLRSDGRSVTVRVGRPAVTPLGGEDAGARISLDSSPQAIVATPEYFGSEKHFLSIEHPLWTSDSDANTTQAVWIRLYAKDLGAAVSAEVFSPVTRSYKLLKRMLRIDGLKRWAQSVQALVPSWEDDWPYESMDEPDEWVEWRWDSLTLCGWLDDISPHRVRKLKDAISMIEGAEIVSPDVARHMLGVLGNDPFPDADVYRFDTAELSLGSSGLSVPSPIRPESRKLTVKICFRLDTTLAETIDSHLSMEAPIYGGHEVTHEDEWTLLDIDVNQEYLAPRSVHDVLDALHAWLETFIRALPAPIKPETERYWREHYGFELGVSLYKAAALARKKAGQE